MTYPERIMKVLREKIGLDENDKSKDQEIMKRFSKDEVFEIICNYEGYIDGAYWIKRRIFDIYGVEL